MAGAAGAAAVGVGVVAAGVASAVGAAGAGVVVSVGAAGAAVAGFAASWAREFGTKSIKRSHRYNIIRLKIPLFY